MTQQRKSAIQLDIIVVGAGLSGLASAIAARLSGHNVTVYESAPELAEVGAGLQVTPNSTRILQRWALPQTLWRAAAEPTRLVVHRYDGTVLDAEEDFDKQMRMRYGAPFVDLHRVDLQRALVERAEQLGVVFRLGTKVAGIDFAAATVRTENGKTGKADLIVAADGLWSACRAALLAKNDPPLPTGDLAYRVVLRIEQIHDPELRAWVQRPSCHFWAGPGAHAVGYSMRGGDMYNIVLLVPDDLPEGVSKQAGSVSEMKKLFEGWDPILNRFLGLVDGVEKWKLMHRTELPSWVNEHANFVFVGDACHPMLPYLAQGANSAIEDGAVLGGLLGHIDSRKQLPQALGRYERLRKARGEAIVRETFRQREAFHMHDGPEQKARDEIFRKHMAGEPVEGAFPSRWTCPQIQPWLYGYDAFQEVEDTVRVQPFTQSSSL